MQHSEFLPSDGHSSQRPGYRDWLIRLTALAHEEIRTGLKPVFRQLPLPDAEARIAALSDRVRHDIEILLYPRDEWVIPRQHPSGQHVYDVVIVGGGQCGLTLGHALRQERVNNFLILDRMPAGQEGPWITYSRMWTLRSPKHVSGPELGMPSLAPRSWFEAIYGEEGWHQLDKWPRQTWHAYLEWFREVLALPVRNDADVTGFVQDGAFVRVETADGRHVIARKVVLATGIEGMGNWNVPAFVRDKLPPSAYTLCTDDVDSLDWKGRKVAILGAGATAWDRGADLLELGAGHVTLFMRRKQILTSNAFRYLEKAGYLRHFASMSDDDKWRWIQAIFTYGQPPTQDGVDRCAMFPNFTVHAGATWTDAAMTPESRIRITASDGSVEEFDHIFIGTGFSIDAANRRELAPFADNIALWQDVFTPPEGQPDNWLITYPYLTRDLRFVERVPGKTPVLANIWCFNYGATVTNAHSGASLSGIRYGLPPLIHGLTHALWMEDEAEHFRITRNWDQIDTDPTPLAGHMWKPPAG